MPQAVALKIAVTKQTTLGLSSCFIGLTLKYTVILLDGQPRDHPTYFGLCIEAYNSRYSYLNRVKVMRFFLGVRGSSVVCRSGVKFVRFLFLFLAANACAAVATRCPCPSDPYDAPSGATRPTIYCRQSARIVRSPRAGCTSAQHAGSKTGSASR